MSDPFAGCRFLVTLDVGDPQLPPQQLPLVQPMVAAGFQEVSGLGVQLETISYPEGGENSSPRQLPVRHTWNRISLKRGITSDMGIWLWYQAGLSQSLGARRNGSVTMLSAAGVPAIAWFFHSGLAVKWDGPNLNANQGEIAIEAMEIAHEGIIQVLLQSQA